MKFNGTRDILLGRSAGAVANCLTRLAKGKKVRLAKKRPRAYVLREAK